jgi:hypothetical protein
VVEVPAIGIYQSMNLAIERVTTRYCIFVNGGDEILNIREIYLLCARIQKHLWAYGGTILHNETTGNFKKYIFRPYSRFFHKYSLKFVPHCSTIFNTNFLKEIGGYDPTYGVASDQALMLNFANQSRPVTTPKIISRFYLGGVSTRSNQEIINEYKLIERDLRKYNNSFHNLLHETIWLCVATLRKLFKKTK